MGAQTTPTMPVPGLRPPGRARAVAVVALTVVLMMINWADKSALGLVSVPIMDQLHIGAQAFGLLGSGYFVTYSASAVLFGWIATRFRVHRILLVLAVLWAVCMLPVAFAPGFAVLLASRVALGFTEAPATPLGNFVAQSWFPDQRRTIPATLVMIGSPLGVLLAGPGLTLLMVRLGWQSVFVTLAAVGLLWCVAWALVGREGPHSGRAAAGPPLTWRRARDGFAVLLTNRSWLLTTAAAFAGYWTITLSTTWMAAFFTKGLGFSMTTTGWLLAVSPGIAIVVMLVWGAGSALLIRRGVRTRYSRGVLIGATAVAGGVLTTVGSLAGDPGTVVVLVALGAALAQPVFPLGFLLAAEVTPPSLRALSVSVFAALSTLAGILAPAVTGALVTADHDTGYRVAFLVAGLVALGAGGLAAAGIHPARDLARATARGHLTTERS